MLRYTAKRRDHELEVDFHDLRAKARLWPFCFVLLAVGISIVYFFLAPIATDDPARATSAPLTIVFFLFSALMILVGIRLGLSCLKTRRVRFGEHTITIATRLVGIPWSSVWYDSAKVYGFGYAVSGHGNAQMLQFNSMGEGQIILVDRVREEEVMAFLEYLRTEGFTYNTSWALP